MRSRVLPDSFEIAPGHRVTSWRKLKLDNADGASADWETAISIFEKRIRSRFIEPADILIEEELRRSRGTVGFAVLAIDFLLIETIQGFRTGTTDHKGQSKALFKGFLMNWPDFLHCVREQKEAEGLAVAVYEQGRCALHHTGSTDRVIVRKSGDLFVFHDDKRIEVNRSALHQKLTRAFEEYLCELRKPAQLEMRRMFKKKMDHICN